jgi:hypothetical protein
MFKLKRELFTKKKTIVISIIVILVLSIVLTTGCQKVPGNLPDTFATTYYLAEGGRSISVSGNSDGMPGEESEYILKINNNSERWQDEYCVLLVDSDSVIQEISHDKFDIPGSDWIQKPITIKYPNGFQGALGLYVIIPQRASVVTTLSIGVKNAVSPGWPDIHTCPSSETK